MAVKCKMVKLLVVEGLLMVSLLLVSTRTNAVEQDIDRVFSLAFLSTSTEVDGLARMSPKGLKLSWARFFFNYWAMEFQVFSDIFGAGADVQDTQFQGVTLSRKTMLEPSGLIRLRYHSDWGQRFHPYMAVGVCYCLVKATRIIPTDDPDFYQVSYEVIDRGGYSAAVGTEFDISKRHSLFLEWAQEVSSRQLKLSSFSIGVSSTF